MLRFDMLLKFMAAYNFEINHLIFMVHVQKTVYLPCNTVTETSDKW